MEQGWIRLDGTIHFLVRAKQDGSFHSVNIMWAN